MKVATILGGKGREVVTINPGATLLEVVETLRKHRIGCIVVTDGKEGIAGIVSERDVVRAIAASGADILNSPASGCMTRKVVTCGLDDTIDTIMAKMTEGRFRHMPVVEEGKLFGSWGSEPETRGGTALRFTTITPQGAPEGEGYIIDGVKHFCTMSGGAHRYMIHCNAQNTTDPLGSQQLALIPHDMAGLSQLDEWDTLGMRGTVSPSMKLDHCVVSKEAVLGEPGQSAKTGVTQGFGLGFAAVYVGAAQAALDFTKDF